MADEQQSTPLLSRESASSLPLPLRYIHGACVYFWIVMGKQYGMIGLGALIFGSCLTIFVSINLGWFAGCATMVLCFASSFCFGAGNAARGKYELAAPILLAALLLVASGILGSHFFDIYDKTSEGIDIGSPDHPVPLDGLARDTKNIHRAHIYLDDGQVEYKWTGEYKWCKDKIPVVGTCVYKYFCVAPVVHEDFNKTTVITAWAGVEWTTSCYGLHFRSAPERVAWDHEYRRGIGMLRTKHWDSAIEAAVKKYGLQTTDDAVVMQWVEEPDAQQNRSWRMGWFVVLTCVTLFIAVICTYNICSGEAKGAVPEARKIIFGPDDTTYQRYKHRVSKKVTTVV